jgi:uncharacterized membrane protein YkvI
MAQDSASQAQFYDWWHSKVMKEADRERLGLGERIGNVVAIVIIALIGGFFVYLQQSGNGFFTPDFGTVEAMAFYIPLVFGAVVCLVRAVQGSRNLGRLLDVIGALLFLVAGSYLLVTFPFDVSRLVDLLPASWQDGFQWVSNDLFEALLMIAIIINIVSLAYNIVLYLSVRNELGNRAARTG